MTSKRSSQPWMNSGMAFHGECWTLNILEHPKDVEESTLSQVVARSAPLKYFLNLDHIQKWLDRASVKKTLIPDQLLQALESQASFLSNTRVSGAGRIPVLKQKGSGTTEKPTRSIQEAVPMLFVRRMLPSEYERLQGFPENWTATDFEL
jgi:hypothetical protein